MNEISQDLINTGEVVSFTNNVIVGTEEEERHDEIVEKVKKILAENNLYMKQEKYKWKIREIRFLRVVIELDKIKMEKEKVKGILDWPTFQGVKNI